ncbi:MAG: hypothetical protein E4G98_03705 [Promethearchaeota archaeon]|nr:MAG: hypothetical protein E4G98_03705 [Candidatus Lokiarchaeota archaeon]
MQTTLPLPKSHSNSESLTRLIPTLIVDERERREIRDLLIQSSLNIRIETLDLGDYLISNDIVIERKRGDDLAGSLCDTRFFTQLTHMAAQYNTPILLLENFPRMFTRNIYEASLYGALLYTCYKLGIRILPSHDAPHTVHILSQLVTLYRTSPAQTPKILRMKKTGVDQSAQLYFLQGLLDVSEKKSATLLEHFGTPWAVLMALRETQIEYTAGGNIKGIVGPFAALKGFGAKFVLKNAMLVRYPFAKANNLTQLQFNSIL